MFTLPYKFPVLPWRKKKLSVAQMPLMPLPFTMQVSFLYELSRPRITCPYFSTKSRCVQIAPPCGYLNSLFACHKNDNIASTDVVWCIKNSKNNDKHTFKRSTKLLKDQHINKQNNYYAQLVQLWCLLCNKTYVLPRSLWATLAYCDAFVFPERYITP